MTQEELNEVLEEHAKWLRTRFCENPEGRWADLSLANLSRANLSRANLIGANLDGADLRMADLSGAKNTPHIPLACPTHGEFVGWKKAKREGKPVLVKLKIPSDAKRSSATTQKCRCDKAIVLDIETIDGEKCNEAYSGYDATFIYRVEEEVKVENFCEDRFRECASGIHFFIDRQEALNYGC